MIKGDLAYWFKFSPETIGAMKLSVFRRWHQEAVRVAKDYAG
jgi:hypothetical protein